MSDWIILNEDTERESLENASTGYWYRKCGKHSGFKENGADWVLCSDYGQYQIAGYTDAEYQKIKASLLGTGENASIEKTLRDEFAMAAMQGLLADSESCYKTLGAFASDCYTIADAMLKEREK